MKARLVGVGRHRGGATAVEFAFIAPVLIALSLGIIEFGLGLFEYHRLGEATRRGAREAVIETPIGQLSGLTGSEVECHGPTGAVACTGGAITGDAEATFADILAGMQDILPDIASDEVYVTYSDSGITDPAVTPGIITPTVTVEVRDHSYEYIILDALVPGLPDSFTMPSFATTRMVATVNQTN